VPQWLKSPTAVTTPAHHCPGPQLGLAPRMFQHLFEEISKEESEVGAAGAPVAACALALAGRAYLACAANRALPLDHHTYLMAVNAFLATCKAPASFRSCLGGCGCTGTLCALALANLSWIPRAFAPLSHSAPQSHSADAGRRVLQLPCHMPGDLQRVPHRHAGPPEAGPAHQVGGQWGQRPTSACTLPHLHARARLRAGTQRGGVLAPQALWWGKPLPISHARN